MKDIVTLIGTCSPTEPKTEEPTTSLPNPALTPGSIVMLSWTDLDQPGYSQQSREVNQRTKEKVYRRYGIAPKERAGFNIDHLIPLSLGGSNDLRNLWPHAYQSDWPPKRKLALEARLRKLVREGAIRLEEAQAALAKDWTEAYRRWVGF